MAGSLNHITGDNGEFTMETIDNMGDAAEALYECHQIIAYLAACDMNNLLEALKAAKGPVPKHVPMLDE